MLRTQVSRASVPGTAPAAGTVARDIDVPGMPVQDMDVQDHPCVGSRFFAAAQNDGRGLE